MIEIAREDYERRVGATLRKELVESDPELTYGDKRIIVEDVKVDKFHPKHLVHILFKEESRSECLFGYYSDPVEWDTDPSSETIMLDPSAGYWGPEGWSRQILATGFMEQVEAVGHGLPPDCEPNGIPWVTNYREPTSD